MEEEVVDITIPQKNPGEGLGKCSETDEGVLSHKRLMVCDESDEMRETIGEASLYVVKIFVVAKTAEDEGACLSFSGVAAAQDSGDSISHFVDYCPAAAADIGGQGLDSHLAQVDQVEV